MNLSVVNQESSGGLNEEGTMALKQLLKFAARRSGSRLCVYSAIAWRRVSCALQSSVAQINVFLIVLVSIAQKVVVRAFNCDGVSCCVFHIIGLLH